MKGKSNFQQGEEKLNVIRRALKEGEESGFADYSLEGMIEELDKESPA